MAADEDGRSLEVIDLRSLAPLDTETIFESVRRTGRCVVVHEAPVTGGLGAEIAARVTEECFYQLEAPVLRVGGYSTPYPPSRLEEHYLPDLDRVLDAVDRTFGYCGPGLGARRFQGSLGEAACQSSSSSGSPTSARA